MSRLSFIETNFLSKGFKVFPVRENEKTPLIDAWQNECSCSFEQVLYWLENAKNCNVALPANENNLFIIDIDMHGVDGLSNFKNLCNDLGVEEINTLSQTTPSGGIHYIFKSDEELMKVMNSANCFENYKGIDIRTKGYILVEPSVINGVPYKLDTSKEISSMPEQLKKFILENNKTCEIERKEYSKPKIAERGNRDTALFNYLTNLYYTTKLDKKEIRLLGHYFNKTVCTPSFQDRVVDYKVDKLFCKKRSSFIIVTIDKEEENDLRLE